MLIRSTYLQGIAAGTISLAFRRWRSPTVKAGGTLRTAVGVLAIEAVDVVREEDITHADAGAAGYLSRQELLGELRARTEGELYRIRLRLSGSDPRERLRQQSTLTDAELDQIRKKLEQLDSRSQYGLWTLATLRAVAASPSLRAADLAEQLGFEKEWLKPNIRKLKELGLTESLETGYRLSPRGQAVLSNLVPAPYSEGV